MNQAEGAGGNVSSLVSSLNGAVALSSEADRLQNSDPARAAQLSSQAEAIATQVIAEALTAREAHEIWAAMGILDPNRQLRL